LSGPRYARQKPYTAQRFTFTQERGTDPDTDTDPQAWRKNWNAAASGFPRDTALIFWQDHEGR